MSMNRAFAVVAFLVAQSQIVSAQEVNQLRLATPGKGNQTSADFSARIRVAVQKWNPVGQQVNDDLHVMSYKVISSDRYLEGQAEGPSRFIRRFGKALMSNDGEE